MMPEKTAIAATPLHQQESTTSIITARAILQILLVIYFIGAAIRQRVAPYRFFQLNSDYFNEEKGLFSKLDMDNLIPPRWRLSQQPDDGASQPFPFPFFVKPEWGQNSYGVERADSPERLRQIRKQNSSIDIPFLLQQAATGEREFEIFYVRLANSPDKYAILSITETINSGGKRLPVNSVRNPESAYRDLSQEFSSAENMQIWQHLNGIGQFRIARVGLRANSPKDLVEGEFQIIEINIFLPMPLTLLDNSISWQKKHAFIVRSMAATARVVATIPARQKAKRIFFRKLRAHYRVKA